MEPKYELLITVSGLPRLPSFAVKAGNLTGQEHFRYEKSGVRRQMNLVICIPLLVTVTIVRQQLLLLGKLKTEFCIVVQHYGMRSMR